MSSSGSSVRLVARHSSARSARASWTPTALHRLRVSRRTLRAFSGVVIAVGDIIFYHFRSHLFYFVLVGGTCGMWCSIFIRIFPGGLSLAFCVRIL